MAVREMSTAEEDQDEATDSDSKPKPARSKQKRKLKKDDHRPSKNRRVASYDEVAIHEVNDDHPRKTHVMNCVRRTTTFGEMHDDDIDLNDVHGWLRTDQCELVVRDPTVQLPSELQRQMAEIKLDHVKKESKAVLENDDKMRAAMLECDIEVKRGRGQVQLMLEKVLARQTMKKEGVPKEEIDSVMPLKEL
ncbi:hypothetical protein PF002_g5000 [Phytophthora fragariae]|nr:hypothetical protein PF003_g19264 [Phytophthora fragariae]KAE9249994.1 hypothetical protein PF002_g5000 [Phytophthora fragariae]